MNRQVLDCASPLALLQRRSKKRQRTGAVQNADALTWPVLVHGPNARWKKRRGYL
jgi:hypothetical protein